MPSMRWRSVPLNEVEVSSNSMLALTPRLSVPLQTGGMDSSKGRRRKGARHSLPET
jgi:hypothetical protein